MSTVLLAVAVIAGLACPAHMCWRMRRGQHAACCPPRHAEPDVQALRQRQRDLQARIAQLSKTEAPRPSAVAGGS